MDLDALWTVAEAAEHAQVSESAIRQWIFRGHLAVAERDQHGRPRLKPLDVARAEYATRQRARRGRPVVRAA